MFFAITVYAYGQTFSDVRKSGEPRIVESFADFGLDYRDFKEERLAFFHYENKKFNIKKLYTIDEFNRLSEEANRTSFLQLTVLMVLSVIFMFAYLFIARGNFFKGLRWLRSGSNNIEDLYRKFRK